MADRFSRFNEERDFQVKNTTGAARIRNILDNRAFCRAVRRTVWYYLFEPQS